MTEQDPDTTMNRLVATLEGWRPPPVQDERELEDLVVRRLDAAGFITARQYRVSGRDRIDVVVLRGDGRLIAIEIKVGGSAIAAERQARRYAFHATVAEVLLLTTRPMRFHLPSVTKEDGTETPIHVKTIWTHFL